MGALQNIEWIRNPLKRRLSVVAMALVLAVLCVWPRQYMARADLMPDDSGGGLSSALGAGGGGLLTLGALLGNHQSIEADLTIARSQAVIIDVVRRMHLASPNAYGDERRAEIKLRHKADIESIRGSILQITVKDRDPGVAKAIVESFVVAVRGRLTRLNLDQAAQKKAVAVDRMGRSAIELANAQDAMARFRAVNRLAAPEIQLGASVTLLTGLQARLEAEQVGLQALRKFATNDNIQVQSTEAEIASLRNQVAAAQAGVGEGAGPTLGNMSPKLTEYENLYRNERYAETVSEIYRRYLDTVAVDELSATTTLDLIEPPYVNPARQYNLPAVGGLVLVLLLGAVAEFYFLRPPPGRG